MTIQQSSFFDSKVRQTKALLEQSQDLVILHLARKHEADLRQEVGAIYKSTVLDEVLEETRIASEEFSKQIDAENARLVNYLQRYSPFFADDLLPLSEDEQNLSDGTNPLDYNIAQLSKRGRLLCKIEDILIQVKREQLEREIRTHLDPITAQIALAIGPSSTTQRRAPSVQTQAEKRRIQVLPSITDVAAAEEQPVDSLVWKVASFALSGIIAWSII